MIDLPLTLSVTILLRMSWLLTVHRYCPASVGLTSLIWRFHSFVCGRTTANRMSSVTRFSSNVNGYEPRSSQATFSSTTTDDPLIMLHCKPGLLYYRSIDW